MIPPKPPLSAKEFYKRKKRQVIPETPLEVDDDVDFWGKVVLIFVAAFIAAMVLVCLFFRPSSAKTLSLEASALIELYQDDLALAEEYRRLGEIVRVHRPSLTDAEVYEIGRAVHTHSEAAGLTPRLVLAVLIVESHGDIYAVSPKGAIGLMQVMPWWFAELGIEGDPFAIDANVKAGTAILSNNVATWGFKEGVHRYFWGNAEPEHDRYLVKVFKTMEEIRRG